MSDTRDNYHADTSRISKSGLDVINRSPYHYWAKYLNPNRPPEPRKKAFVIGSITNDVLLQPHLLDEQYVIVPADAPRRPSALQINAKKPSPETLAAIEWWDNFNTETNGRTVVEAEDYDRAARMCEAIHDFAATRLLLNNGEAEKTILFDEPETGTACKCRPDWISSDGFLLDLKTTADASPDAFGHSALSYRYHVQASFYSDGYYFATDNYPKAFIFLVVEKEYPFAVACYYAEPRTIELGHAAYMRNLQTYAECLQTGIWPGYSEQIEPLKIPEYIFKQI